MFVDSIFSSFFESLIASWKLLIVKPTRRIKQNKANKKIKIKQVSIISTRKIETIPVINATYEKIKHQIPCSNRNFTESDI